MRDLRKVARQLGEMSLNDYKYLHGLLTSKTQKLLKEWFTVWDAKRVIDPNGKKDEPELDPLSPELESALERELLLLWWPRRDLLESSSIDEHFVVEVDDERVSHLRFGDGRFGRQPEAGMGFIAYYRVGGGPQGNVGRDRIQYIVFRNQSHTAEIKPRNPLAARGGQRPEAVSDVKLLAPQAFTAESQLERAIIPDDYARLARRHPRIQNAAAALRWMGSWYEVLVVIDPYGRETADTALLKEIEGYLYRYRRIGHDLVVKPAQYVPLDIVLDVCVRPAYVREDVKEAIQQALGAGLLRDGRKGFFHPDNLTFGAEIAVSRLTSAAMVVSGVESVTVKTLNYREKPLPDAVPPDGVLKFGPLEIPQLENNPAFPAYGVLVLEMRGGR